MRHLFQDNDDDDRRKRMQSAVQRVFQERMEAFLDNTKAGQQTQNRFEQSQHLTGIAYLAISAIYSAMSGATITISEPSKGKRTFGKAFATPGSTGKDAETQPVPDDHPAAVLFQQVNSQDTFADLMTDWIIQECLHGITHLWANPNVFGQPVELWCIPSSLIRYQAGPSEQYPTGYFLVNWYQAGGWSNSIARESGVIEIASEQILVSKLKHPVWKWDGYSPLTAGGVQLDLLESIDIARKSAMEKGGINGGIVSVKNATQQQLEDLQQRYIQKHAGPYNSGAPLFVDGDAVSAAELGGKAKDMDYSTAWKDITGYALSLFNVPPAVIQSANSNYAQLYASLRQFYTFNLQPRAHRYAQFLQKHLVRPHWGDELTVQIDLPKLDDPELQHQMFTAAPSSAWTINEYRQAYGHDPIPDGDVSAAEFDARTQAKVQKETQPPQPQGMPGMPQPGSDGKPDLGALLAGGGPKPETPQPEAPKQAEPLAAGSKGPNLKSFKRFLRQELKHVGTRYRKSFAEDDHPRDDHGQFVSKDDIAAASNDKGKADALRSRVSDPGELKKLNDAIGEHKDTPTSDKTDSDNELEDPSDTDIPQDSVENVDVDDMLGFYSRGGREHNVRLQSGTVSINGKDRPVYRWNTREHDTGQWTFSQEQAARDGEQHLQEQHPSNNSDYEVPEAKVKRRNVTLTDSPLPKGNARLDATSSHSRAAADEMIESLFPETDDADSYRHLTTSIGAPDGAVVKVHDIGEYKPCYGNDMPMPGAVGVRVEMTGDMFKSNYMKTLRFIGVDRAGKRFIKNESIALNDQGAGLGADIFAKQVETASQNGFDYITTHAAKSGSMNGYATWPKFGYDMHFDDKSIPEEDKPVFAKARELFPGVNTVQELFAREGGEEWWSGKKNPDGSRTPGNGTDLRNAKFDLTPGSVSMARLQKYLQRVKATKPSN